MIKNRLIMIVVTLLITQTLFGGDFKVGGEIKTTSSFNQLGGVSTDVYGLTALENNWALGTWALGNTGNSTAANLNFQNSWTSQMGIEAKSFITLKSQPTVLATDWGAANLQLTNAHIEMQGFMFSPGATIWAGLNEDYRGIHILEFGYRKFSGLGFGLKGYRIGDASIDLNFYNIMDSKTNTFVDEDNPKMESFYNTMTLQTKVAMPISLGNLEVEVAGHIVPSAEEYPGIVDNNKAYSGIQGGVYLNIPKFFVIDNGYTEWAIQAGYGLPTGNNLGQSHFWSQGNKEAFSARAVYSGLLDTPEFQIMSAAAFQYDIDINQDGESRMMLTAGARPIYQLDRNFALMAEYGFEYINDQTLEAVSNSEKLEGSLHKGTAAFVITLDEGFWARPQIRIFATYTTWDPELNSEIGPSHSTFGDEENMAINFGINMEAWF